MYRFDDTFFFISYGKQNLSLGRHVLQSAIDKKYNRFDYACFNCGYLNHSQRNCPISRCKKCKKYGHQHVVCMENDYDVQSYSSSKEKIKYFPPPDL